MLYCLNGRFIFSGSLYDSLHITQQNSIVLFCSVCSDGHTINQSFSFNLFTVSEVQKVLKSLEISKSAGPKLKLVTDYISLALSHPSFKNRIPKHTMNSPYVDFYFLG